MQMNLSTIQEVQNVLVKQYQKINRRVQPIHTRVDLKEPSGTDSPGTGTGAPHVPLRVPSLSLEEHLEGSSSVRARCNCFVYPHCLVDLFELNKIDKDN